MVLHYLKRLNVMTVLNMPSQKIVCVLEPYSSCTRGIDVLQDANRCDHTIMICLSGSCWFYRQNNNSRVLGSNLRSRDCTQYV